MTNFLVNLWVIKVISPNLKLEKDFPLVSVLIPARNEASNIANCVKSLQKQTYSNLEILVLDDESQDETALIVSNLASKDNRVKLYKGKALPDGWVGKSWACYQLSEFAKGEWLLFTDADTSFESNAISASLAYAISKKADLLSILPTQLAVSKSIEIMIPLVYFTFYTLFPAFFIDKTKNESVSAAIGQFLLFNRQAYIAIDGHKSVSNSLVEDLDLAKKIKSANKILASGDGSLLLSCSMYQSFSQLWNGFTKNFFASFSFSIVKLLSFSIFCFMLYIWPFFLLIFAFITINHTMLFLASIQITVIYLIRFTLSKRHYYQLFSILLHPIATILMIAISFNSIYRILSGQGVEWKGRGYQKM
jgi:chlorobactene glucosyltransferase